MELVIDFTKKASGYKEAFMEYMESAHQRIVGNRAEFGTIVIEGMSKSRQRAIMHSVDHKRVCAILKLNRIEGDLAYLDVEYNGPMGSELKRQLEAGIEFEPVSRVYLNPDNSIKMFMNIDLVPVSPLVKW